MKLRCLLALLVLVFTLPCLADGPSKYQHEPKVLLKIVTALENSKIPALSSRKPEGERHSYHLSDARFLGTVDRKEGSYVIAFAFFLRSSPPDSETPPARGHHFIVVLDPKGEIAAYGRVEVGEYNMAGTKLFCVEFPGEEQKEVADFGSKKPEVRFWGYPLVNLAYPFPDRITEEEYEAERLRGK